MFATYERHFRAHLIACVLCQSCFHISYFYVERACNREKQLSLKMSQLKGEISIAQYSKTMLPKYVTNHVTKYKFKFLNARRLSIVQMFHIKLFFKFSNTRIYFIAKFRHIFCVIFSLNLSKDERKIFIHEIRSYYTYI